MENLLNNPQFREGLSLVLTQGIAFLLFVWVLKKFAWKPVLKVLDERRENISNEFKRIEELEAKFNALKESYEKKHHDIEQEARLKLQEQIQVGKKIAEQISETAHHNANDLIEKGRLHVEMELEKARKVLQQDVADMVFKLAEKLILSELNDAKHRELLNNFMKDVGSKHGQ